MEKALHRQRILLQHLKPSSSQTSDSPAISASICSAGEAAGYHRKPAFDDDVVIVAAYRTAICKAKRGGFKDNLKLGSCILKVTVLTYLVNTNCCNLKVTLL
ncbi:3-ketoacyl CoA thiolase 1, peroxisomal-like [Citrus sinensis]|uniref:3-ketoacyl CoA thiolase 1, peroxisomal-like n=1 Tax=Citrus sinensis TaxID=2711 RepID=UPI0022789E00|nr:3-ketoacyl CoA thiolase 1, peroxisomal-like [Citrus sinensis]